MAKMTARRVKGAYEAYIRRPSADTYRRAAEVTEEYFAAVGTPDDSTGEVVPGPMGVTLRAVIGRTLARAAACHRDGLLDVEPERVEAGDFWRNPYRD